MNRATWGLFSLVALVFAISLCGPLRGADPPAARTDSLGDPLPPGAVLRLGTTRLRHLRRVLSLSFTPDRSALISTDTEAVRVWEVATGKELPPVGETGQSTNCAVLSPDGKVLAVGDGDEIVLWDFARREPIDRLREPHESGASALAFSPDGKTLAALTHSRLDLRLWEVSTGKLKASRRAPHEIHAFAFSPDGKTIAVCHRHGLDPKDNNRVALWRRPDLEKVWEEDSPGGVFSLDFFPDGKTIAVAHTKGPVRYFAADSGRPVKAPEVRAMYLALSPDGKALALGGPGPALRLCDPRTGRLLHTLEGPVGLWVTALTFSPNGKVLAAGSDTGEILLWDTGTGRPLHSPPGHRFRAGAVRFSPDGRSLASRGGDQTVRVWDLDSGKERLRIDVEPQAEWDGLWGAQPMGESLAYSPDGRLLAGWGPDHAIRLWDARTGELRYRWEGHRIRPTFVLFSPDGKTLASADYGGALRLWEVGQGGRGRWLVEPQRRVGDVGNAALRFSPDGQRLAGYCPGDRPRVRVLAVWEVGTGERTHLPIKHPSSFAFLPDGELAVVGSRGDSPDQPVVRLIDTTTGKELRVFTHHQKANTAQGHVVLALSPDGRYLASTDCRPDIATRGIDWSVHVVEVPSGQEVLRLDGHRGPVNGLDFSPDGMRLATASDDGSLLVWDLLHTAAEGEARGVQQLWTELADARAEVAYRAQCELARRPEQAVPLLGEHLRPVKESECRPVAQLVSDLDAEAFAVREAAFQALLAQGHRVEVPLQQALGGAASVEVRGRLRQLLDRIATGKTTEVLREERALTLLEWLGSPPARQVLKALARGAPEAPRTRQAQAALRRLEQRAAGR